MGEVERHSPSPLNCQKCGEQFHSVAALSSHVKRAHSVRGMTARERPHNRGPVACGQSGCDHSFQSEGSAVQHRMAKHGITP